jgi:hypothetical protein
VWLYQIQNIQERRWVSDVPAADVIFLRVHRQMLCGLHMLFYAKRVELGEYPFGKYPQDRQVPAYWYRTSALAGLAFGIQLSQSSFFSALAPK